MKTDTYTKIVLTVIAVCLMVIVLRDISFVPTANATPAVMPVQQRQVMDVRIVDVEYSVKIPVEVRSLPSSPLPVKIEDVGYIFRALPVEIKK